MKTAWYCWVMAALLLAISASAQTKKKPDPCADAKISASEAESRLAGERLKEVIMQARLDALERELATSKGAVAAATQQTNAEHDKAASASGALDKARQKISEQRDAIAEKDEALRSKDRIISDQGNTILSKQNEINGLTAERDADLRKLKSANRRTWIIAAILSAAGIAGGLR